jgi:hypothetical protein
MIPENQAFVTKQINPKVKYLLYKVFSFVRFAAKTKTLSVLLFTINYDMVGCIIDY